MVFSGNLGKSWENFPFWSVLPLNYSVLGVLFGFSDKPYLFTSFAKFFLYALLIWSAWKNSCLMRTSLCKIVVYTPLYVLLARYCALKSDLGIFWKSAPMRDGEDGDGRDVGRKTAKRGVFLCIFGAWWGCAWWVWRMVGFGWFLMFSLGCAALGSLKCCPDGGKFWFFGMLSK